MSVYIYECRNCQRIYPRTEGQPLACPFCQSKEREELGNGFNALELIDNLIGEIPVERFNKILQNLEARQKEQDNG